jgi:hypothetical protein
MYACDKANSAEEGSASEMDEHLEGRTQVKMQTYMSIETKPS